MVSIQPLFVNTQQVYLVYKHMYSRLSAYKHTYISYIVCNHTCDRCSYCPCKHRLQVWSAHKNTCGWCTEYRCIPYFTCVSVSLLCCSQPHEPMDHTGWPSPDPHLTSDIWPSLLVLSVTASDWTSQCPHHLSPQTPLQSVHPTTSSSTPTKLLNTVRALTEPDVGPFTSASAFLHTVVCTVTSKPLS